MQRSVFRPTDATFSHLRIQVSERDTRRVADDERHVHFVTFSCFHRRQLLEPDHVMRIVIGQLGACLHQRDGLCTGFVIMPDHVHALLWFPETGQLSDFVRDWKGQSSRAIARWFAEHRSGYWESFEDSRVWQTRYYSFNVFSRGKLEEKLDYMHLNPVRAGLVKHPLDWKWSSARWYRERKPVGLPIQWPPGMET